MGFCRSVKKESKDFVREVFDANQEQIINEILERLLPIITKHISGLISKPEVTEPSVEEHNPTTEDIIQEIVSAVLQRLQS